MRPDKVPLKSGLVSLKFGLGLRLLRLGLRLSLMFLSPSEASQD